MNNAEPLDFRKLVSHEHTPYSTPTAIIALMMEAASTSKTSVKYYQTTGRNFPEDSHLHTRRRENLKSQLCFLIAENFQNTEGNLVAVNL
jgi:hypothetical protein